MFQQLNFFFEPFLNLFWHGAFRDGFLSAAGLSWGLDLFEAMVFGTMDLAEAWLNRTSVRAALV
jgi:hypothetical protein